MASTADTFLSADRSVDSVDRISMDSLVFSMHSLSLLNTEELRKSSRKGTKGGEGGGAGGGKGGGEGDEWEGDGGGNRDKFLAERREVRLLSGVEEDEEHEEEHEELEGGEGGEGGEGEEGGEGGEGGEGRGEG
jgi:hypothetical protein